MGVILTDIAQNTLAGQSLDPADARGRGVFRQDQERPDLAQTPDMGAAAKFKAIGPTVRALSGPFKRAHRDNAHLVAIFFTKQRLSPKPARVVRRHDAGIDGRVLADERVHLSLNGGEFGGRHGMRMREVKAQPIRRVQAPPLGNMIAQGAPQRLVQQVRGRMVGANL